MQTRYSGDEFMLSGGPRVKYRSLIDPIANDYGGTSHFVTWKNAPACGAWVVVAGLVRTCVQQPIKVLAPGIHPGYDAFSAIAVPGSILDETVGKRRT
jgi:hypothetical protein